MKKSTRKIALIVLTLGAIGLAACDHDGNGGGGGGGGVDKKCPPHTWGDYKVITEPTETTPGVKARYCTVCNKKGSEEEIPKLGFPYEVVFKNAEGAEISKKTYKSVEKIEKPADPTAPAGMTFYGWKNVKNGGQIWNFDDDTLGLVADNVELVPCFVPANTNAQYLEAELCPAITGNPPTVPAMHGATYSGGADGTQLIYIDEGRALGSTCEIPSFKYYKDVSQNKYVLGDAPADTTYETKTLDMKGSNSGAFVHFNYNNGNTFTFNITCSAAVDNVVMFASFSSEYGLVNNKADNINTFDNTEFPISVNGTALEYGRITMHNVPNIGKFLPFQDYLISASVSLKEGENVITMKVDNEVGYSGTLPSSSPCIDSLKLFTSATITWSEARYTNIIK